MKKLELKIGFSDWLLVIIVAVLLSSSISSIIYIIFNIGWFNGLISGSILGIFLSLFSCGLITINNHYLLPKISKPAPWWMLSALFAFIAGFVGFYSSFEVIKLFYIPIPETIIKNVNILALYSGFLNYFMGLLIYLFVRMKAKKQELENLLIEGRIISLNNQLNSHFIFNVLNNIIELINIDKDKAEESLVKLSKFLRKVISEKNTVQISEEIDYTKAYVELENIRYGGLIKLNIQDSNLYDKMVIPRFSIQLIVENAIKHGFNGNELNVDITFKDSNDSFSICIANDGNKIKNLKFGTGLLNLSKRLKLLCNGRIKYATNMKTEFIIEIPKK